MNIKYLKENGIIVFIDRPLNNIKKDVDISLEMIKREFYDNTPSAFIDVIEKL